MAAHQLILSTNKPMRGIVDRGKIGKIHMFSELDNDCILFKMLIVPVGMIVCFLVRWLVGGTNQLQWEQLTWQIMPVWSSKHLTCL